MPAYNEAEALPHTVFAAVGALETLADRWELVVVDVPEELEDGQLARARR